MSFYFYYYYKLSSRYLVYSVLLGFSVVDPGLIAGCLAI